MSNEKSTSGGFNFMTALLAIVISIVLGILIYMFVLGAPGNFDAEGQQKLRLSDLTAPIVEARWPSLNLDVQR